MDSRLHGNDGRMAPTEGDPPLVPPEGGRYERKEGEQKEQGERKEGGNDGKRSPTGFMPARYIACSLARGTFVMDTTLPLK